MLLINFKILFQVELIGIKLQKNGGDNCVLCWLDLFLDFDFQEGFRKFEGKDES